MNNTAQRLLTVLVATMLATATAWADTEIVDSIEWTYTVSGGEATITGFSNPTSTISIPATLGGYSVTCIGEAAFYDCSNLTQVTIPNSVTCIDFEAFAGCTGLTSVTIPDSVTSIWDGAFAGCTGLTSVTIPDSVEGIGVGIGIGAFANCNSLYDTTTIPGVKLVDGWAVGYESSLSGDLDLTGVRGIGPKAFASCWSLTSVTIPDSVSHIGDRAFANCAALTSVKIDDGVTYIGYGAFGNCWNLLSVTIGNGMTNMGCYVFDDCNSSLFDTTTISGVKLVDGWAVGYEWSLSGDLDLTGVRGIGDGAFSGCDGLTSVMIPESVTSIGDEAFAGCDNLRSIYMPGRFNGNTFDLGIPDGCVVTFFGDADTYAITFDQQDGSGGTASATATYGSVMPNITVPTRTGFTFGGYWTAANGGGTQYYTASGESARTCDMTSDTTLYAKWTGNGFEPDTTRYLVVDLSGGANAESYPVSYLADIPTGGWTDEYKTTKLVLKRIEAGTFKMGGSVDVTLTKPFFIGLFEVTQKQYSLISGSNPSNSSGDKLPVERVGYSAIRGSSNGAQWPASNAVDSTSFLGKLRARTGLDFDLPTEAQWEYACRAGTTTVYSYGDTANGNYMWYSSNNPSSIKPNEVGTKSPNPWGLYDMHGNVWEWCLDWYNSTLSYGTDPKGSSSGTDRVQRGGSWARSASVCTSSYRGHFDYLACGYSDYGFRLACAEIESFAGGGEAPDANAISDALDCTNLEFTISGPRNYWVSQTDVSHDGVDAVRCDGILADGGYETNALALTVTGPGELSFWWKVDNGGDDSFTFEFHEYEEEYGWIAMAGLMADDEGLPNYNWAGGEGDGGCTPDGDWVKVVCNVGEGEHSFRWFVATVSGGMFGNKKTTGRGFLDCVSWTPANGVYTETVNGIEWTYSLQYGRALIGTGLQGQTAIPATTAGPLTIPSTLGGCPVTRIRDWAFANCEALTSVTIPDGVGSIGDCAFSNCTRMAEIAIPDGVASIGMRAFYYCGALRAISIPYGVERIEQDTFSRCFSLADVSLPDSLKSIGKWAFSRCDALQSITLPQSLQTIEHGCFDESRLLTSVTFPESLTRIDSWAFARTGFSSFSFPATVTKVDNNMFFECTNLVSVTIPDTVTSIGGWVFQRCRKLESLTIPDSVTKIGDHAFLDCSALPTLRIPSGVTEIGGCAFQNCVNLGTLYLPERFRGNTDGLSIPSECTVIFYGDDHPPDGLGFADALGDALEWTSGGKAEWMVVEDSESVGGTCARSGAIGDSESSWLETTVEGPGIISFRWKVSSQARLDRLSFSVDDETKAFIAGTAASVTNWAVVSFVVEGDGTHALRWTYAKSASGTSGEDCGWIDDVQWAEVAPNTSEYGEALDAPDLEWTVGGDDADAWVVVDSPSFDGEDACAAFANGAGGLARIATEVEGPGTVLFRWRVESGTSFAGIAFMVDGEDVEYGESEAWARCEYAVSGEGAHTLAWEYYWDGDPDGDAGFLDCVSWTPATDELIPILAPDATPSAVSNAIESVGFTDAAAVEDAICGSAALYADFKAWAQNVEGGEAAVVASRHAAVSWLLGASSLFAHRPDITISGLAMGGPQSSAAAIDGGGAAATMSVTVVVKDGENVAQVAAEKIAGMFEATSDLGDWNGKAKLTPTVGDATRNPNGTMTFTVSPGDGTAKRAFLRIRMK